MTDRDQEPQEEQDEGFGWFGVPPRPVVNQEQMEAAMARAAIRPEDMGAVAQRMWEEWEKRQQDEQSDGTEDATGGNA